MDNTELLREIIRQAREANKAVRDGRERDAIDALNDICTIADRLLGQI